MDKRSLGIVRRVWKHSGIDGFVWTPSIANIGKSTERFRQGAPKQTNSALDVDEDKDWYWTPAVSLEDKRRKASYPAQRVLWIDCDEGYNDTLLQAMYPTFMWETSPGHKQAIWLMDQEISPSEFSRDGLMGLLAQAIGGDKSGVDIPQLLRIPGTVHHKGKPFVGKVLRTSKATYTTGQIVRMVAKGLGYKAGTASEIGADIPFGDRSKQLWKFEREAADLGLPEDLTFKLMKASKWNKWPEQPELLREDIAKAYAGGPSTTKASSTPSNTAKTRSEETSGEPEEEITPWSLEQVGQFGTVIRKPLKWIVPKIIPEASVGMLVAAPKVGKTRIAIELALGVATAQAPLGLSIQDPQPVGFFSLEDGKYLYASRLSQHMNHDPGRFQYHWEGHIQTDGKWYPAVPMPLFTKFGDMDLNKETDRLRLENTIVDYGLKLVIIDTLGMSMGDKIEISNMTDMNGMLKPVRKIARRHKCSVMFIHHTRKRVFDKGESIQEMVLGSTALHAWSDFIMTLATTGEEKSRLLRLGVQTKMGSGSYYLNEHLKII